jgi:hypothetical protein
MSEAVGRRACEKLTALVAGPHPASPSRPAAGWDRRGSARPGRQRRPSGASRFELVASSLDGWSLDGARVRGSAGRSVRLVPGSGWTPQATGRRPGPQRLRTPEVDGGRRIDASAWPSAVASRLVTRINPRPRCRGSPGPDLRRTRGTRVGAGSSGTSWAAPCCSPPPMRDVEEYLEEPGAPTRATRRPPPPSGRPGVSRLRPNASSRSSSVPAIT